MKKIYIYFFILCIGCSPGSKTEYLSKYKEFIVEVKDEWKSYSEADWDEKSEEFEKFSIKCYKKFKGELIPSEIVKVYRFDFVFHFYKGDISAKKIISGAYNEVLKESFIAIWEEVKRIGFEFFLLMDDIRTEGFSNIINRLIQ